MNHPVLINHSTHILIESELIPVKDGDYNFSPYYVRQLKWRYYGSAEEYWDKIEIEILLPDTHQSIFTFARNCPQTPPLLYVKQNNEDFLVSSGNYQCISIYNITRREFKEYVYPKDEEVIHWRGFCPISYKWKDDTLTVTGQKPYGPMEIMIIPNVDLNHLNFQNIEWDDYYKEEGE